MEIGPPPRAKRMKVLKKEITQCATSACGQFLAEFDAESTDGLPHAQDSAASVGEGSTSVNRPKGTPALTRPSR